MSPNTPAAEVTKVPVMSPAADGTPSKSATKRPRAKPIGVGLPLLYVEWEDHHSNDEWQVEEDVDAAPVLVHTVGWLIKETDGAIVLATNVAPGNSKPYSNTMTILKGSLKKRVVLRRRA